MKKKQPKTYVHLRIEDEKLKKALKISAANQGVTIISIVEQAIREYLKKALTE